MSTPSSVLTSAPTTGTSRVPALSTATLAPVGQAVLRIGAGVLFMQHGVQKLFGLLGGVDGAGATVELSSQLGLAGVLEVFGGALIVLGLFTRPVAALLTGLMVVAYGLAHAPQGLVPVLNGGELALIYALVFSVLAAGGAGAWSLDGRLRGRLRGGR